MEHRAHQRCTKIWALEYRLPLDFERGSREEYYCGEGNYIGECLFTPRSTDSPEGEGFIVTVMWNMKSDKSSLLIFDALHVSSGPLAIVEVPRRIEYDFHGSIITL